MSTNNPYLYLSKIDLDLASIYKVFGPPPAWQREPGFATLVHIILEQQVSLASAKATLDRLTNLGRLTPEFFIRLNDDTLRACAVSRQKIRYCRVLAQTILDGFNLEDLHKQDDETIRSELIKLPGIGNWTIDVYLIMALNSPDIFPIGDLALQKALRALKHLNKPSNEDMLTLAKPWQPYRSYATKLLWHYYLSGKTIPPNISRNT